MWPRALVIVVLVANPFVWCQANQQTLAVWANGVLVQRPLHETTEVDNQAVDPPFPVDFVLDAADLSVYDLDYDSTNGTPDDAVQCEPKLGSISLSDPNDDISPYVDTAANKLRAIYSIDKASLDGNVRSSAAGSRGAYQDIFTYQLVNKTDNTKTTFFVNILVYPFNGDPLTSDEIVTCSSFPPVSVTDLTGDYAPLAVRKGGNTTLVLIPGATVDNPATVEDETHPTDTDGDEINFAMSAVGTDYLNLYTLGDATKTPVATLTKAFNGTTTNPFGVTIAFEPNYEKFAVFQYRVSDCSANNDLRWDRTLKSQGCRLSPSVSSGSWCKYTFTVGTPDGPPPIFGVDQTNPIVINEDTVLQRQKVLRAAQTLTKSVRYFTVSDSANPYQHMAIQPGFATLGKGTVEWYCGGAENCAECPGNAYGCFKYTPFPNRFGNERFTVSYIMGDTDADVAITNPAIDYRYEADGSGNCPEPKDIWITINPVNDLPIGAIDYPTLYVASTRLNDTIKTDGATWQVGREVHPVVITIEEIDENQVSDYVYLYGLGNSTHTTEGFSGRLWSAQTIDPLTTNPTGNIDTNSEITNAMILAGNASTGFGVTRLSGNALLNLTLYYSPGVNARSPASYPLDVIYYVAVDTAIDDSMLASANVSTIRQYLEQYVANDTSSLGKQGLATRCLPGYYVADQFTCLPCAPGTYSTQYDSPTCTPCLQGEYQDQAGQTGCLRCPLHTYMDHTGAPECTKCPYPMITFGDNRKDVHQCVCPGYRTLISAGNEAARPYPELYESKSPGWYGVAGMFCLECHFGTNLFATYEVDTMADCPFDNMTLPLTKEGYFLQVIEFFETSAYSFSGGLYGNVTGRLTGFSMRGPPRLTATGQGMQRIVTTNLAEVTVSSRVNSNGTFDKVTVPYKVVLSECYPVEGCPDFSSQVIKSMTQDNFNLQLGNMTTLPCKKEYDSARCSTCRKAPDPQRCPDCVTSYRLNGQCRDCPPGAKTTFILIIGIVTVVLAPGLFKLADVLRSMPSITVSLNFAQVLALFPTFHVPWPPQIRYFWEKLSFFNLNIQIIHPECLSTSFNWASKFRGTAAAPLVILGICIGGVVVVYVRMLFSQTVGKFLLRKFPHSPCKFYDPGCTVRRSCLKCKACGHKRSYGIVGPPDRNIGALRYHLSRIRMIIGKKITKQVTRDDVVRMGRKAVSAYFTFLKVGYLFLAGAAIEYWDCNEDRITKRYYLDADQSILCFNLSERDGGIWKQLFGLGLFTLLAYPIGILVIFAVLLRVARKDLKEPAVAAMLGPLYENYVSSNYFWELIISARKMLILAVNVFFSQATTRNGLRQTIFTQVVLLVCLLLHVYRYPYKRKMMNVLEAINLLGTFFAAFVGMAFLADETGKLSPGFKYFLVAVGIVASGLSGGASAFFMALDMAPKLVNTLANRIKGKQIKEREKRRLQAKKAAKKAGEEFRDVEQMQRVSLSVSLKLREFCRRARIGLTITRMMTPGAVRATADQMDTLARQSDDAVLTYRHRLLAAFAAIKERLVRGESLSLSTVEKTPVHKLFKEDVQAPLLDALLQVPEDEAQTVHRFLHDHVIHLQRKKAETLRRRGQKRIQKELDERERGVMPRQSLTGIEIFGRFSNPGGRMSNGWGWDPAKLAAGQQPGGAADLAQSAYAKSPGN